MDQTSIRLILFSCAIALAFFLSRDSQILKYGESPIISLDKYQKPDDKGILPENKSHSGVTRTRRPLVAFLRCHDDGFWSEMRGILPEIYFSNILNATWVLPEFRVELQQDGHIHGVQGPFPFENYLIPKSGSVDWFSRDEFKKSNDHVYIIDTAPSIPRRTDCHACPGTRCIAAPCPNLNDSQFKNQSTYFISKMPESFEELQQELAPLLKRDSQSHLRIAIPFHVLPFKYFQFEYIFDVPKQNYYEPWKFVAENIDFPAYIKDAGSRIMNSWGVNVEEACGNSKLTSISISVHIRDGDLYALDQWKVINTELRDGIQSVASCVNSMQFTNGYPGSPWSGVKERDALLSKKIPICGEGNPPYHVVLLTLGPFVKRHRDRIKSLFPCMPVHDFSTVNWRSMAQLVNSTRLGSDSLAQGMVEVYVATRTHGFVGTVSSMTGGIMLLRSNKQKCNGNPCSLQSMHGAFLKKFGKGCASNESFMKILKEAIGNEKHHEIFVDSKG